MSNYTGFDVLIREDSGLYTAVPDATVQAYDATNEAALPDVESDANGHVPAGTFDVDAGTLVYFSIALPDGRTGWARQVTF